ncbi:invasin [Parashewanella curva]|uniref:Invasin n=1 Tax=Parashewanella curva TaxID=2338552 RepID=A0A3L8Q022_9GAMM|nr:invasin [Parashewanella curva]RLV61056.1 invasin [Parashewanella curva]
MKSGYKLILTLLSSFLLFACGGGGDLKDEPTNGGGGGGTPQPVKTISLDISNQDITKDTPATLTVTVKDSSGNLVKDELVSFSIEPSEIGTFLNNETGKKRTNEQGVAIVQLAAKTLEGDGQVTASIVDGTQTKAITKNFSMVHLISLFSLDLQVQDNQGDELRNISLDKPGRVVATLQKNNAPISNEIIKFELDGEGNINPSTGTALTNGDGKAIITLLTGTQAGAGTITAKYQLDTKEKAEQFNYQVAGDAPKNDGNTNKLSIGLVNNNTDQQTSHISEAQPGKVIVNLTDENSQPLIGKVVSFSSTLGNFIPNRATALTDANGRASITITAGSIEGAGEITATYGDSNVLIGFTTAGDDIDPVAARPVVSFKLYNCNGVSNWDRSIKNFEVCAETNNVTNKEPAIVGITVRHSGSNQPIKQVLVSGTSTLGTISPETGTALTNDDGKAILDLLSGEKVGAGELTVTVKDISSSKAFEVGRSDIRLRLTRHQGTGSLPAGSSTVLAVLVENTDGTVATDQPYSVELNSSCKAAEKATIDSPVVTNAGRAFTTYTSTGCDGEDIITASIQGASISSEPLSLTTESRKVGSIQYVSATPKQLAIKSSGGIQGAGSRSETSVVTFKLVDEAGQPATQELVCFELSTAVGGMTLSPQPLAAHYDDCSNLPDAPADLTSPNKYATAFTNGEGEVSVTVKSGSVPTPVKVYAQWSGSSGQGLDTVISNISDELSVSTGLADNDSFSLAGDVLNPEAWSIDGEEVTVTIRSADHFNNPVPAGTKINFRSEGGTIASSCATETNEDDSPNGTCELKWESTNPRPFQTTAVVCPNNGFNGDLTPPCHGSTRLGYINGTNSVIAEPRPGRATITAWAIGEESFVDLNGNGLYDSGEPFSDIGEAFSDHNEDGLYRGSPLPAGAIKEEFIDYNTNQTRDAGDGLYTGLLCATGSQDACSQTGVDNLQSQLNVYRNMVIVMSGSQSMVRLVNIDGDNITPATNIDLVANPRPHTVYVFVSDQNNNTLPMGTTVTAVTDNGEISGAREFVVGNNISNRPLLYSFTVGLESSGNQKTVGQLSITVKTPKGSPTVARLQVRDNG